MKQLFKKHRTKILLLIGFRSFYLIIFLLLKYAPNAPLKDFSLFWAFVPEYVLILLILAYLEIDELDPNDPNF